MGVMARLRPQRPWVNLFQFTKEEARTAPDVVFSIYLFDYLLNYVIVYADDGIILGIFLMNSIPALVLLELGASQSFVSTSFYIGFIVAREALA